MSVREATHAGSWYTKNGARLSKELDTWLGAVVDSEIAEEGTPVPGARVIIAPHAGYSYSGPAAAWAYKAVDLSDIKRVFILGPSHHVYFTTCRLSAQTEYATPLGNLRIDAETNSKLESLSSVDRNHRDAKFERMSKGTDEDEHSIEMHLPYTYKILQRNFGDDPNNFPPIVPILVGSIDATQEKIYGAALKKYLEDTENVFIVSSDFCHWGSRFQYTAYRETPNSPIQKLQGRRTIPSGGPPIYKSIEGLDREGMAAIESGDHNTFVRYLALTKNTICGRHPIGVVMAGLEDLIKKNEGKGIFKFVRYEQSSHCTSPSDSSVSYASAFART
ncbi:UPF0103-domain-containing protein [Ascobolus immersus RN42]|uniref:UPF0103-domain-containing protein n=1 Tax=Ascobolus immersus RN42 TaxID=1160509 RepID=A0A3N4IDW7_ASCIM|nr:UPF0103-domain-containing protein [Ascobolus immersus RN42]